MNELTTADPRNIHAHIKAHSDAIFRIKLFYYSVNFFLVQLFRGILLKKRGAVEVQAQLATELLIPLFDLSDRLVIGREAIECILVFDV